MPRTYFVYILANRSRTLYTGVTNDIHRRVLDHQSGTASGFTRRYLVRRLVYVESTTDVRAAIAREKEIKGWLRAKKLALIEAANPGWTDLAAAWSSRGEADVVIPERSEGSSSSRREPTTGTTRILRLTAQDDKVPDAQDDNPLGGSG